MAEKQPVFDRILLRGIRQGKIPARTKDARSWFRDKAKKVRINKWNFVKEAEQDRKKSNVRIGHMYFFQYSAKYKEELPYWDAIPLIFPIGDEGKHFLGINLHYLPPRYRAKLMDALYSLATNKNYDEKTKLAISYKVLKGAAKYKYFKPCIKRYLKSNVRSKFIKVDASEWDIALFLPLADWRKASSQKVYSDSRRKIAKS